VDSFIGSTARATDIPCRILDRWQGARRCAVASSSYIDGGCDNDVAVEISMQHPLDRLHTSAVQWSGAGRARVRLLGRDARAFVHRMSTNHTGELAAGTSRLNVLANQKGRIVDVVHHLDLGDDGVLLVGSEAQGPALLAWLDRFIFVEQIELKDESAVGSVVEVAGATALAIVDAVVPGAGSLAPWSMVRQGSRLAVRSFDFVDATGAHVPHVIVIDDAAGFAIDAPELAADDVEIARIAAGIPTWPHEVGEAHTPLDLDLHDGIHWAKGCYIGQEVIARLDTYQKQSKHLASLTIDPAHLAQVQPGMALVLGDVNGGVVTSTAPTSWGALPNALGTVKLKDGLEGAHVQLVVGDVRVDVAVHRRATEQQPHD
jgi:hypothetical protein